MEAIPLFSTPLVSITDIRCRPDHAGCSDEECSESSHIVFPRTGAFVKHLAGREVVLEPSQVMLSNAGETYRVSHPVPGGDDCTVFEFRNDVLIEGLAAHSPGAADRPLSPFERPNQAGDADLLLAERVLRRRVIEGLADTLEVEEAALALLDGVAQRHGAHAASARRGRPAMARLRRERVEAVKLLVARDPSAELALADIARHVHSSPFHLARSFQAAHGTPIHRYQLGLRLALALDRLLDGEADITALALDLGFASHSHFTAAFRRNFGTTPSALRREINGRRADELRKNVTA